MKQCTHFLIIALLFASAAFAQNIATPVFILKDGDASAAGYSGTENDLFVDGGSQQSVVWITFQTQGIDISNIASAKLLLYVKGLTSPGTLQVQRLTSDITAPENNVRLTSIPVDAAVAATQALGNADVEKVIQIDLTTELKSGTFKGVALTSDDGLTVIFDSKEGHLAPVILLTSNVSDVASKWHSGSGVPTNGFGRDDDYFLDTVTGNVYSKASGTWVVVTNIVGPQGHMGDKGDQGNQGAEGAQGLKGDKGDQGNQGIEGAQGLKGDKGDQGNQGIEGAQGLKGDKGDQGNQGVEGAQGLKGDKGDQGNQGVEGAQGLKGDKGDQGLNGATGATGYFPEGTVPGDMQYWNGAAWTMVPVGQPGQFLQVTSSAMPSWSGAAYPAVTTSEVSSITQTAATGGGNVSSDGGATSTARGVCWNTSVNPVIANHKTIDGTGTGAFSSSITGLTARTTYYVRAYATNSAGTIYGNQVNFTTTLDVGTGITPDSMLSIPAGTFLMGCQQLEATPIHSVTVSAFKMSNTDVTQGEYLRVMGKNPSLYKGDNALPVEHVTWFDAVLYCNQRSKLEQKDTVYSYNGISGTPGDGCTGLSNLQIYIHNNGYRLPTEAEWEYACRAGTTTDFYWGRSYPPITQPDTMAINGNAVWHLNSNNHTWPVGSKQPNAWGLYDMVGNLWQWLNDWNGTYTSAAQDNPTGPANGSARIGRGGSYSIMDSDLLLCSGIRNGGWPPYDRGYIIGFRVVQR